MINPYQLLNEFIIGKKDLKEVLEYLKNNQRNSALFSFYNISRLLVNSPRIQYLLNKYLNSVYFTPELNTERELKIIQEVLKPFQINNQLNLQTIINQGKQLSKLNNIALNNYLIYKALELFFGNKIDSDELSFLKLLFDYKLINDEELYDIIEQLKEYVKQNNNSNKKSKNKIKKELIKRYKTTDVNIEEFLKEIEQIKSQLKKSDENNEDFNTGVFCEQCPLKRFKRPRVDKEIYNPNNSEYIEVFIIGLNPGKEEVLQNRPFIGKSGQILRQYIHKYLEKNKISYLITNVIQCHTNNETELKDLLLTANIKTIEQIPCNYVVEYIKQYKPKYILCFGKQTCKILQNKITNLDNVNAEIFCLKHPSYYIRKGMNYPEIEEYNEVFSSISNKNEQHEKNIDNNNLMETKTIEKNNIIEINDITEIPIDRLLVDIKILKKQNKYLILTTDENGNKYYYLMPFKTEFYYNIHGEENPRYNPHVMNFNRLKRYEIQNYDEYEKLKNKLRVEYRKYFELK